VEEEENEEAQEEAPKDEAEIKVGAPGGGSKSFAALRYSWGDHPDVLRCRCRRCLPSWVLV
jgi:DNA-directed RNA polymerase subunit M/transcription elongation factor TFIIS